jgi:hypothetical protein
LAGAVRKKLGFPLTSSKVAECDHDIAESIAMLAERKARAADLTEKGPPMRFADTDSAPSASSSSALTGLAHGAVDALVLNDLDIGAFAGFLEAEEHGGPHNRPPHNLIHSLLSSS